MASDDRLWAEQLLAAGTQLLQMALTPSETPELALLSLALVTINQGIEELELAQEQEMEAERIPYVHVQAMEHIEKSKERFETLPQAGAVVVATHELTEASASFTRNSSRLRSQALVSSQSSSATTSSHAVPNPSSSIAFSSPQTQLESTAPTQTLTPPSRALNSTMSEYQAKRWLRQETRKQKRQQSTRKER